MNNRSKSFWLFLAPSLLAMLVVLFIPLLTGTYYSMTDWNGIKIKQFLGLANYIRAFQDKRFLNSIWFTAKFSVAAIILVNIIGLGLALLVTQRESKLNNIFRTVFFMPNLIGGIILGFIWQFIFMKAFTAIGDATGIAFFQGWLSTTNTGFWGLVILFIWQMSGYIMIIYISFINNIPGEMIEAAKIDGATPWQAFWRIKFPMLAPAFTVSLFLTLSSAFKIYDQNLALTSGGPFDSTQMVAMNIVNEAFAVRNMGYAQAKAVIFLMIITIISIVQINITRKREVDL
ncbi:ABC transporter permease [Clostridia bacterium]|nr:ABC transporter permease [Clostridia bacterium]